MCWVHMQNSLGMFTSSIHSFALPDCVLVHLRCLMTQSFSTGCSAAKSQTSSSTSSVDSDRSGPNYSQTGEEAELRYLGQAFINLEEVLHYSFLGLSSIWLLGEKFQKDYAQKVLDIDTLRSAQICQFLSVLLPPFICLDSLKGPVAASHIGLFSHDLCSSVLLMIAFLFRLPKSYLSFSGFLCQFQKMWKKASNGVGISTWQRAGVVGRMGLMHITSIKCNCSI